MSLRVLLADESASIRKVFQMGLQDFGAEVKSVHNGLDVIEVAQSYQPHIIFADILLQKKNGYEVCQEISKDPNLNPIPVVLMWSSFMELDQGKYQACGAKGELEKPFDVENMRTLIKSLVGRLESQKISEFLSFPDSITAEFKEEQKNKPQKEQTELYEDKTITLEESVPPLKLDTDPTTEEQASEGTEEHSIFNIQVEDVGNSDFSMYEVTQTPLPPSKEPNMDSNSDESWEVKPINDQSFVPEKTDPINQDLDQFQSMDLGQEKKMDINDFLYKPESTQTPDPEPPASAEFEIQNVQVPDYDYGNDSQTPTPSAISPQEAEAIIRSETRAVLERTMKEQLPRILEKVVKEELEKIFEQELALKNSPPQA